MGNLTRKQRRYLRNFTAVLSSSVLISAILIGKNIADRHEYVPVVFSDILDGAVVTAGTENEEISEIILEDEYLYETLFEDFETIILTTTPGAVITTVDDEFYGAGGTLLIDTTEITVPIETTTVTSATTTPVSVTTTSTQKSETEESLTTTTTKATTTTTKEITTAKTTTTTKATTTTAKTTKKTTSKTTTAATEAPVSSTSKTPFINVGGGVISEEDEVYITMLNLVNEARVENGLEKLWYSARVHEISTLRAYELSSYYSHSRSDGRGFHTAFIDAGINYKMVGENIAYGRNMFKTPEEVFEAWMNSKSHRENILNPDFECVGFGLSILEVDNDTYYYWTQEFAKF